MRDKNGVHEWTSIADEYERYLQDVEYSSIYGGCRNYKGELVDEG